jgi:hypothetical protein
MIPTLIAAAIVGALAPVVRGRAWGVPFGLLSIATVLRSFIGSFLTVLVLGSVALVVLKTTSMVPAEAELAAAVLGAALGLALLWSSVRRMRDVRGLSVLCQRIQEDDAKDAALSALDRLFDRVRRRDGQRYIALVLMATGPLTAAGMWGAARDRLRSLDDFALTEAQAVLRNQALATCELQFDDVEAAQRAIDAIARPTEPSIEVWLVAMEALLMAVRGESERALAHIGAQSTADNPSLQASHRLVHAHIYAARGDEGAALRELERLLEEAGRAGLERVTRPRGPATALAEHMLAAEATRQSG